MLQTRLRKKLQEAAPQKLITASPHPTSEKSALDRACAEIANRWQRFGLSEFDALEQADNFRRRAEHIVDASIPPDAEFDGVLEAISDAMALP